MNIGMLTYYNVHNYGAVLQMYALAKVFKNKGLKPVILQFIRNYRENPKEATMKYDIGFRSTVYYLSLLRSNGLRKTFFNFLKFIALKQTKNRCFNLGDYYNKQQDLDYVCIGSDEVFAIDVGFNSVLYGNDVPCKKIFSYAGCFGKSIYDDVIKNDCADSIIKGFNKMQAISVRDKNSRDIVAKLTKKEVPILCDPVILYGFKDEIAKGRNPIKHEDYCVVYSYDSNMNLPEEIDAIKKFAREHKLKIISVGFFHEWCDSNIVADPLLCLKYFSNAAYVITDTFHGTIMSVITQRPFVTLLRNNKNKVAHLLESLSLSSRAIEKIEDIAAVLTATIDYAKVDEMINEQRLQAHAYLDQCLGIEQGE